MFSPKRIRNKCNYFFLKSRMRHGLQTMITFTQTHVFYENKNRNMDINHTHLHLAPAKAAFMSILVIVDWK